SPPQKNKNFCPISLLNTVLDCSRYFSTKIKKVRKSPLKNWLLAPKIPAKKNVLSDFTCEYSSGQLIRFPDEKIFPPPLFPPPIPPPPPLLLLFFTPYTGCWAFTINCSGQESFYTVKIAFQVTEREGAKSNLSTARS